MLLPLCTLDEVRADLALCEDELERMADMRVVSRERWEEQRAIRVARVEKLRAQVAAMEADGG